MTLFVGKNFYLTLTATWCACLHVKGTIMMASCGQAGPGLSWLRQEKDACTYMYSTRVGMATYACSS